MPRSPRSSSLMQSPEFVRLALSGVEQEIAQTRERLAMLNAYAAELRKQGRPSAAAAPASAPGSSAPADAAKPAKGRKRKNRLSPEARKALSERMAKKWAEFRKQKEAAAAKSAKKG